MEIVSLVNKKGGVAKTTTALALASGLSKRKFKVLAIDCDAQGNFSKASGGEDDVVGTFDILTGKEKTIDAIQELPEYVLIGGDKRLSGIDVALNKPGREYRLKKALEGFGVEVLTGEAVQAVLGETKAEGVVTAKRTIPLPTRWLAFLGEKARHIIPVVFVAMFGLFFWLRSLTLSFFFFVNFVFFV